MTAKSVLEYTQQMSLLYVEDDIGLQENTKLLFENFFASVTTANDGQDGLDKYFAAHSSNTPFSIVISDINMPHMDGITMAEAIFKKEPLQPLIFITAHNEVSFLNSALQIGASGFLTKPIQNDLLLKTLYRLGQAFCDRKYFLEQYNAIEQLNVELIAKNNSLQKLVRLLDTNIKKEQIASTAIVKEKQSSTISQNDESEQIKILLKESLYPLKELHYEIDTSNIEIINLISKGFDYSHEFNALISNFERYAHILVLYHFLNPLSQSILSLTNSLKKVPKANKEVIREVFELIESSLFGLEKWHNSLEELNIENINYFRLAVSNDINNIIRLLENTKNSLS